MGDVFDALSNPDDPPPGLTIAKLRAAAAAMKRGAKLMPGSTERRSFYMDRSTWIRFGGRSEDFDALPTVDFGDEVTGA